MSEKKYTLEEVERLLGMFTENGLTKFSMSDRDFQISFEKETKYIETQSIATAPIPMVTAENSINDDDSEASADSKEMYVLEAPIIGCFYEAASPDSVPFVAVGSRVRSGDVVCIIESMKLMNEVTCDVSGTVDKIYVENGQVLEYGQPIMQIIPED